MPICSLPPPRARTISINLYNSAGDADNNQLDAGELAGVIPVDGEHWNNIGFANGTLSGAAAQKNLAVKDDGGHAAAATFISTLGSGWVGYSGASLGGGTAGSRDLMNSYLSFDDPNDGDSPNDTGGLQVTGIGSAFTTPGYDVIVYFDTDNSNRTPYPDADPRWRGTDRSGGR